MKEKESIKELIKLSKCLSEPSRSIWLGSGRLLLAAQQMEEEKGNTELKGEESNEQKENPYTTSKV